MASRPANAQPPDAWPVCQVENLAERLAGSAWTLVEFWAPDNLFCRLMAPIRAGLRDSHAHRLQLVCCTLNNCNGSGAIFGAVALPALILFRNARRIRRWLGATDLSLLRHSVNAALGAEWEALASVTELSP